MMYSQGVESSCSHMDPRPYCFFLPSIESSWPTQRHSLFGILGSRCLTGSALLDCHALEGFGIYMIGILDSSSGVWKPITGTHRVASSGNLDM